MRIWLHHKPLSNIQYHAALLVSLLRKPVEHLTVGSLWHMVGRSWDIQYVGTSCCCDSDDSGTDVPPQGAAAVLFMQICRRIHSRLSSGTEPSPITGALTAPLTLHKCGYRILLQICESSSHYCN